MAAIGFSLGSNVLSKYVGEEGGSCRLSGAMSIACPLDCVAMSTHLNTTLSGRLLDPVLVASVQKVLGEIEDVVR